MVRLIAIPASASFASTSDSRVLKSLEGMLQANSATT